MNTGVARATGEIVHRLDADMVVFPEHVEALARWHQEIPDAVTLGYKRFVEDGWSTPEEVARRCADGTIGELFDESVAHDYIERLIDTTDQLRAGDHLNFLVHVRSHGGPAARVLPRHRWARRKPGHRRGQRIRLPVGHRRRGVHPRAGRAEGRHMGASSMMRRGPEWRRFNHPHLADLMPQPRWLRHGAGRTWRVPLVTAVVPATGSVEVIRSCVDRLLASTEDDLRIILHRTVGHPRPRAPGCPGRSVAGSPVGGGHLPIRSLGTAGDRRAGDGVPLAVPSRTYRPRPASDRTRSADW